MQKQVRNLRDSFQKDIKLDRSVVKPGQAMLLSNFTKNNAAVFYRQAGKSFFNFKVQDSVIFNPELEDPSTLIMCTTKDQTQAIYGPYFRKNYGKIRHNKEKVMSYKDEMSAYVFNRAFQKMEGFGYVEVGGCGSGESKPEQAKRGRTKDLLLCDEYADWPKDYFDSVLSAQGDVRDAPHLKTGTAKPGIFEDDFLAYEQKMRSGDPDYFALKWTILHALKYGEVTKRFVDEKYEYYASRKQLHVWESEYMLNFKAYLKNRPFGGAINKLFKSKRFGEFPLPQNSVVDTFWDLGVNGTVCWIRYSNSRGDYFYTKYLEQMEDVHFPEFVEKKLMPYITRHRLKIRYNLLPADGRQRELMSKGTRLEQARTILPGTTLPLPVISQVDDAIDFTKGFFDRCYFDKVGCDQGIRRLELYEYKGKGIPKDRNVKHHHAADAFIVSAVFNGDGLNPGLAYKEDNYGFVDNMGNFKGIPQDFDAKMLYQSRDELTKPLRGVYGKSRNWGY